MHANARTFNPETGVLDLQSHYGNGPNVYQYLGSSPWGRSDPLGLTFGYDDLAMWAVGGIRGGLEEMVNQYAANMTWDVEWANDWSTGDDWHSRLDNSWVDISFAIGFYRGLMEQIRSSFYIDELEAAYDWLMGGGLRPGKAVRRGVRIAGQTATFSAHILLNGAHVATRFKHPQFRHYFVRFTDDVIIAKGIKVRPTNSFHERAQAKRIAIDRGLVPRNVDWTQYRIHHHWVVGEMQIIKREAHIAAGHIGRAATWPPEVPVH